MGKRFLPESLYQRVSGQIPLQSGNVLAKTLTEKHLDERSSILTRTASESMLLKNEFTEIRNNLTLGHFAVRVQRKEHKLIPIC